MEMIKTINLAVAFFLEMAMLVAFAYFGFHFPENTVMKFLLVITLPVIAVLLWGYFAAPKSKHRLQQPSRVLFSLTMFGAAIFLLNMTGKSMLAAVFAIMVIINQLLQFILKQ
jgi:hypothetical protein